MSRENSWSVDEFRSLPIPNGEKFRDFIHWRDELLIATDVNVYILQKYTDMQTKQERLNLVNILEFAPPLEV